MRRVIDGKTYNTETASVVCDISPRGFYSGDFRYEDSYLYKSPKGTFFIAGTGGPMSRWAVSEGENGRRGGSGMALIDLAEARELCERYGNADDFAKAFGEPEEG